MLIDAMGYMIFLLSELWLNDVVLLKILFLNGKSHKKDMKSSQIFPVILILKIKFQISNLK